MSPEDFLMYAVVAELRKKSATSAMKLLSASRPDQMLNGLPGPLALMLAGEEGGWLSQALLSSDGKPVSSSQRVHQLNLASRYAGLAHAARKGPHARAQVAFAWLGFNQRIQNPNRNSIKERSKQTILDWSQAKEKVDALASKIGLDSEEVILSTACEQLDGRWGDHTGRLASMVARSVVPGASPQAERAWLTALSVMRQQKYHWNPGATEDRCLIRSGIAAAGGRVAHPRHYHAPDPRTWESVLPVDAITEVLVQCWVIACQPDNPAVKVKDPPSGLAGQWANALVGHVSRWPDESLRLGSLVAHNHWDNVEGVRGMDEQVKAFSMSARLPSASPSRRSTPRM